MRVPVQTEQEVGQPGAPNTYQRIQSSPDDFGALSGRATEQGGRQISSLGSAIFQLGYEQEQKEKAARSMERRVESETARQDLFYGDKTDPATGQKIPGLLNTKLGEAESILDRYERFNKDRLAKIQAIPDKQEREFALKEHQTAYLRDRDAIMRHRAAQTDARLQHSFDTNVQVEVNKIANSMGADPKLLEDSLAEIRRSREVAMAGRYEKAEIDQKIAEDTSKALAAAAKIRAEKDPVGAYNFFEEQRKAGRIWHTEVQSHGEWLEDKSRVYRVEAEVNAWTKQNKAGVTTLESAVQASSPDDLPGERPGMGAIRRVTEHNETNDWSEDRKRTALGAPTPWGRAMGPMQLIPDTARRASREMRDGFFDRNTTPEEMRAFYAKHPEVNRAHGRWLLNTLADEFNGNPQYIFAAYFAGTGPHGKYPGVAHAAATGNFSPDIVGPKTYDYAMRAMAKLQKIQGAPSNVSWASPANDLPNFPKLPQPGAEKLTPENWNLSFYKKEDILPGARDPEANWVDARTAYMADYVGKAFFDKYGIRVPINEGGLRMGTATGGHSKNSYHYKGMALDFQIKHIPKDKRPEFLTMLRKAGFTGFFFSGEDGHLHVDTGTPRFGSEIKGVPIPSWAQGLDKELPGTQMTGEQRRERLVTAYGDTRQRVAPGAPGVVNVASAPVEPPVAPPLASAPQPINPYALPSRAEMIADLTERFPDPKDRALALSMVDKQRDAAEKEAAHKAKSLAAGLLEEIHGGRRVDELDRNVLAFVETHLPQTRIKLLEYQDKREKANDKTDWEAYERFSSMGDRELSEVNPADIYTRLSDEETKEIMKRRAAYLRGDTQTKQEAELLAHVRRVFDIEIEATALGRGQGDDRRDKTELDARRGLAYKSAVDAVRRLSAGGKIPDFEATQKIIQTQVLAPAGKKYAFELGDRARNEFNAQSNLPLPEIEDETEFSKLPDEVVGGMMKLLLPVTGPAPKEKQVMATYNAALRAAHGHPVDPASAGPLGSLFLEEYKIRMYLPENDTYKPNPINQKAWNDPDAVRVLFSGWLRKKRAVTETFSAQTAGITPDEVPTPDDLKPLRERHAAGLQKAEQRASDRLDALPPPPPPGAFGVQHQNFLDRLDRARTGGGF